MNEQVPGPEFDPGQYERPNQDWLCGKMEEGKPCRIGPDLRGRCRGITECRPILEKGAYVCARMNALGKRQPCSNGPSENGLCSQRFAKCSPIRTIKAWRKLFTFFNVAFTLGLLVASLCGPYRAQFISPGKVSAPHSTDRFVQLAGKATDSDGDCAACHQAAQSGILGLLSSAVSANPGPLQVRSLAAIEPPTATPLDRNCEHCHAGHSFHQINTVRQHSCSACHVEHRGTSPLGQPRNANCLSCHANGETMVASAQLGETLAPAKFEYQFGQANNSFRAPHPPHGYSNIIHSFSTDHPEFQLLREKLKDSNTLKFSHNTHFNTNLIGETLHCENCHKLDATGTYYRKMSYNEHCSRCHRLQFDPANSDLLLPHGNPEHIRAFLNSLPSQYEEYNARKRISDRDSKPLVRQQINYALGTYGSLAGLEQRLFFSEILYAPTPRTGSLTGKGASYFPGCAKCHEVKKASSEGEIPVITKPFIPERWLTRGKFDHNKHSNVDCQKCHETVKNSKLTADILLPLKTSCVKCHSPEGGVASNCSTCHNYHLTRTETLVSR